MDTSYISIYIAYIHMRPDITKANISKCLRYILKCMYVQMLMYYVFYIKYLSLILLCGYIYENQLKTIT